MLKLKENSMNSASYTIGVVLVLITGSISWGEDRPNSDSLKRFSCYAGSGTGNRRTYQATHETGISEADGTDVYEIKAGSVSAAVMSLSTIIANAQGGSLGFPNSFVKCIDDKKNAVYSDGWPKVTCKGGTGKGDQRKYADWVYTVPAPDATTVIASLEALNSSGSRYVNSLGQVSFIKCTDAKGKDFYSDTMPKWNCIVGYGASVDTSPRDYRDDKYGFHAANSEDATAALTALIGAGRLGFPLNIVKCASDQNATLLAPTKTNQKVDEASVMTERAG
jgi:hypothetical protein